MDVLQLLLDRLRTPIGEMLILADRDGHLRVTDWVDHEARMRRLLLRHYGPTGFSLHPTRNPHGLTKAIAKYFAGDLDAIEDLPVATHGTPFQQSVWRALRNIPCGTTVSYLELARQIGRPAAVRAVGLANGANPVGVVVPCHRVIGANGSLTGYGGGLERKRWLLEHERQMCDRRAHTKHRRSPTVVASAKAIPPSRGRRDGSPDAPGEPSHLRPQRRSALSSGEVRPRRLSDRRRPPR